VYKMSQEDIKAYTLAGKAVLTLESTKTGKRYTYKIKSKPGVWFVSLLTGSNNDCDYTYIAFFREDLQLRLSNKSAMPESAKPVQAFKFFLDRLGDLPDSLNVYHSGKCGRCGRTLTVPESIKIGLGATCASKS